MIDIVEIQIHCAIINNGTRKAWLIQDIDYSSEDMAIVLDYIKTNYSCLVVEYYIGNYYISKDILDIAKKQSTMNKDQFDCYLGKILGYTCKLEKIRYTYDIVCSMGSIYGTNKYNLFSFGCSCVDDKCSSNVKRLVEDISKTLSNIVDFRKYNIEVNYIREYTYSTSSLIDALISRPTKISEAEKWEIKNYLYNLCFTEDLHVAAMNLIFQYENPVHIGILIGLLLNYENSLLEPFCPLQKGILKDSLDQIDQVTKKWEESIIDKLQRTMK